MRALVASLVILLAATLARADVSVDVQRWSKWPRTPLGRRCDDALAAAQVAFGGETRGIDFHVRERRIVGEYAWSDMCGVWGNYTVELAPDLREPQAWRWTRREAPEHVSVHRRGTRRGGGWRATFIIDGDSDGDPGDAFVAAFRPALEVCLAGAR